MAWQLSLARFVGQNEEMFNYFVPPCKYKLNADLIVFVDADDPNLGCINTECPKGQKMGEKL